MGKFIDISNWLKPNNISENKTDNKDESDVPP
ncbi:hypothetical protein FNSP10_16900 [Fusobacterium nucleatum]|nr:hypothetical protein FNCP10_07400 [Fusobacterium nucleatum]BEP08316.1 hypothetical protein FNSP10_16900 [Fusobacterium nucleatum]